jgi:hypothetical protein
MAEIVSQYRIEVNGAVEALNKVADATGETEKGLKKAGEAGKTTGKEIADAGKMGEAAIGSMSPMLGRVIGGFKSMIGGVKAAIMAMKTLKVAVAATGIGLLVLAIGAMVTAASKVQPVIDKVRVVFAQMGAAVSVVIDRVAAFGAGLFDILSGDVTGGIDKIRNSFKGIGDEIEREIALAGRLEEQLIRIEKAKIITSTTVSKLRAEIEKLNATYGDTTVSLGEQLAAQQKILKLREQLSDLQVRDAQERIANALGQETVNEKVQSFIDRMTTANNVLLTTSERAKVADELIKEIGISESTVSDLENVAGLIDQLIQAESERFQGTRRTNSAIAGLANQQKQIEQQRIDDARKAAEELAKAEEERVKLREQELAAIEKIEEEHAKRVEAIRKQLLDISLSIDEQLNTSSADVLRRQTDAVRRQAEERHAILLQSFQLQLVSMEEFERQAAAIDAAAKSAAEQAEKDHAQRLIDVNDAKNAAIAAKDAEAAQYRQSQINAYVQGVQSAISTISNAFQSASDFELSILEDRFARESITRDQYERERKSILRKQAQDAKAFAIMNAVINTALGVTQALGTLPPPASFIIAALTGVLGGIEIGIIASEPIPQFAEGGWVDARGMIHGRSHAKGGVRMEAEGGEFIVNRVQSSKNAALIEAINKGVADAYIMRNWVAPAVDAALLNGWQDVGKSADLNNLTANLKDHNIIRAMDRNREATTYGFTMLAKKLEARKQKRGGYD